MMHNAKHLMALKIGLIFYLSSFHFYFFINILDEKNNEILGFNRLEHDAQCKTLNGPKNTFHFN